ncbi:MAG: zinc-binding dehydrogenase [Actinomycetota bacterium]
MKAIEVSEFGGPEVLVLRDLADLSPVDGFELIEVSSAGVNYADTHQIDNSYLAATTLPLIPGAEVIGTTADGRRVMALLNGGGYAQQALAHPRSTFDVPDGIEDGQALALLLQGSTAWHILATSAKMSEGESIVVHAGAGGVGTIAIQLAKRWGAGRVIATASSPEKRALALELGADVALDSNSEDLKQALQDANDGAKVDIVLEMTGGATFDASLAALAPFGRLITYGSASRSAPSPVDPGALIKGSRGVIGFWLAHCFSRPGMIGDALSEMLAMAAAGELRPVLGGSYPLSEARRAHEDLRARVTTGKLVLDPSA